MAIDLEVQKEVAKVGMTVSMGLTVATAFKMKNKRIKKLHVGAGVALVAFSLWHHSLYAVKKKAEKNEEQQNKEQKDTTKEETSPVLATE